MQTKRHSFDLVNAGRTRREPSALGNLSDKLAAIEDRLGMHQANPQPQRQAQPQTSRKKSTTATELDELREQLRAELRKAIDQEFRALTDRLDTLLDDADAGRVKDVSGELSRLSKAVSDLSALGESQGVDTLRREMDEMKQGLDQLAREKTVREASDRWENIDKRWAHFERQMSQQADARGASAKALDNLQSRMEAIGESVSSLPQSHVIGALQDDMRALIDTVHKKAANGLSQDAIDTIDARLDELSRAVVAAQSRPAEIDTSPLERIEARLTSLAKQVQPSNNLRETTELARRMEGLTERVEALTGRSEAADNAIERIAHQLGTLTQHLEKAPPPIDLSPILSAIETRMETVATSLERSQREAREHSEALFRELDTKFENANREMAPSLVNEATERALGEIEERLSRITERMNDEAEHNETERQSLLDRLDQRFNALSDRMHESISDVSTTGRENFESLHTRLSDLSEQVESGGTVAHAEAISNLEHQIAELSAYLSSDKSEGAIAELSPRLTEIERGLQRNQDEVMEAARQAVENTLRTMRDDGPVSGEAMNSLGADLRTLEELSRLTEDRNARTFEAIHETMLKIVDRLAVIEDMRLGLDHDDEDDAPLSAASEASADRSADAEPMGVPSSADTALATIAAMAPDDVSVAPMAEDEAFLREFIESDEPSPSMEDTLPDAEVDLPDEPMEPGSGAPDLDAVIGQVRSQKDTDHAEEGMIDHARNAKADFVAAARRAAQAAAADTSAGPGGQSRSAAKGSSSKSLKTPLMLLALCLLLAFGGWQIYATFFDTKPQLAQTPAAVPASQIAVEDDATAEAEEALIEGTIEPSETVAAPETDADTSTASISPAEPAIADDEAAPQDSPEPTAETVEQPVSEEAAQPSEDAAAQASSGERSIAFGTEALQMAVSEGDPAAWYEVGTRYAEGRGVDADMETAAGWFGASADAGYVPAQYRIALSYEKAMGVERDAARAVDWYRKAAEGGNARAMHNLGVLYAQGAVGAPDNEQALRWFMDAAEYGIRDSQFNLGILNARGIGTPQDLVQSYKWFALAAKSGDTDAAEKRDEVAKALRPEQLERAQGIVELWKPKALDPAVNDHMTDPAWLNGEKDDSTASVDMKKAIQNIQGILINQGYELGAPDGVMGKKTEAAIASFQRDHDMEATGRVDEALIKALLKANAAPTVDADAKAAN
ncbi:peptidoglycan-binding protein [Notoacmeibacter ruber]|uniref:Peptidoglycan binding-like domain-containing protein n=1 Tax=Notoacmeibacter ruber TaxID=2670375 RepID=A0A3L7J9L8_9HYPH|nr:peptidoglycan-binding protein [Notoacmeibacter ruber]RLQ87169.1 hypothetical protein D8780_02005 [Notoacmeibacter ruber]